MNDTAGGRGPGSLTEWRVAQLEKRADEHDKKFEAIRSEHDGINERIDGHDQFKNWVLGAFGAISFLLGISASWIKKHIGLG